MILWKTLALTLTLTALSLPSPQHPRTPQLNWDHLEGTVLFVGSGRSGSSLVGALLDAHPRIIIPNEYDLINNLEDDRESMFRKLYNMSERQAEHRDGGGGYDYKVPHEWQGKVEDGLPALIGDKKATLTTQMGFQKLTDKIRMFQNITRLPLKIIHVTRNPFDNIATLAIVKYFFKKYGISHPDVNNITHDFEDAVENGRSNPLVPNSTNTSLYSREAVDLMKDEDGNDLDPIIRGALAKYKMMVDRGTDEPLSSEDAQFFLSKYIRKYFARMETVSALDNSLQSNPNYFGEWPAEIIHVDHDALVADPKKELHRLIDRLGLKSSSRYLSNSASIVWQSHHYTRLYVKWGEERICEILHTAQRFGFLQHYMVEASPRGQESNPPCRDQCFPGSSPCPCALICKQN